MSRKWIWDTLAATPLLVVAFVFLSPLRQGDFLTDDYYNIRFTTLGPANTTMFDPDDPMEVLHYFHMKATDAFQLYRPLVAVSFRASLEAFGLEATPWITSNIILHLLGGLLLVYLLGVLFPDLGRGPRLLGMMLFLLSPLQIQVSYWSAARSDSLCWIFGSLALILKWQTKRRLWLPLLFAWLSLCSKEAGIFFLGLVGFCDLLPEDSEEAQNGAPRWQRILAFLLLLAGYFAIRISLFGNLGTSSQYGHSSFAESLRKEGWDYIWTSLKTAWMPVSPLIVTHEQVRLALRTIFGLAHLVVFLWGIRCLMRRRFPRFAIVAALTVFPFLMAAVVSRLDDRFINTRCCYIPMFGVAALIALVAHNHRRLGYTVGVLLLVVSALVSWPLQVAYVQSGQETRIALNRLREALKDVPGGLRDQAVILNFHQVPFFKGGFTVAGCLPPAILRPFLPRDVDLKLVNESVGKSRTHPFLMRLDKAFPPNGSKTVLAMRYDPGEKRFFFTPLHPLPRTRPDARIMEGLYPKRGQLLTLDPRRPETLRPRFRLRHPGPRAARYRLSLLSEKGRIVDVLPDVTVRESGDGQVEVTLTLQPLPGDMARKFAGSSFMVWVVHAMNRKGEVIAHTPLTPYMIRFPTP